MTSTSDAHVILDVERREGSMAEIGQFVSQQIDDA